MFTLPEYSELKNYFAGADHIDVKTIESRANLREFIAGMLSYHPPWLVYLFRIRTVLVSILGLVKHESFSALPSVTPDGLAFEPGKPASFFTVRAAREETYWVSETPEDKHLVAFIAVIAQPVGTMGTRYSVFTSVFYKHWTGPVYFNLIRPFHHIVVRSMMRAAVKSLPRTSPLPSTY
jgi:hypothetical protein